MTSFDVYDINIQYSRNVIVAINIDCYNFSKEISPSAKLALNAVIGL